MWWTRSGSTRAATTSYHSIPSALWQHACPLSETTSRVSDVDMQLATVTPSSSTPDSTWWAAVLDMPDGMSTCPRSSTVRLLQDMSTVSPKYLVVSPHLAW